MSATLTSPALTSRDQLDGDLAVASVALGVARSSYARCPSAENARLLDRAVAAVDRLLDQRLTSR